MAHTSGPPAQSRTRQALVMDEIGVEIICLCINLKIYFMKKKQNPQEVPEGHG